MASTPYFVQTIAASNGGGTNNVAATFPYPNTTGNLIVVQVNYTAGNLPTGIADQAGNTYHHAIDDGVGLALYYAYNTLPRSGTNKVTVTFAGSNFYSILLGEYGGVLNTSNPLDKTNTNSGSSTSASTGTITPSQNLALVMAAYEAAGGNLAPSNGFTERAQNNFGQQILSEYVQPTAAAINATASCSNNTWSGVIASFLPASGNTPACAQIGAVTAATTSLIGITPIGAQSGDVLFFFLGCYNQNVVIITPPPGATLVPGTRVNHPSGGDDSIATVVYQLILSGTPASTYTFSAFGGLAPIDVTTICVRFTATTPLETGAGAPSTGDGFSTAPSATSLTTASNVDLLCWFWFGDSQVLTAVPIGSGTLGFTAQIDGATALNLSNGRYGFYTMPQVTAAATGNVSATTGSNDDWIVTMIAVRPPQVVTNTATSPTNDAVFFGTNF